MDIVTPEEITTQHLKDYWSIFVIDDKGESMKIWDSRRILPFVPNGCPGTVIKDLYVRVPSLDNVGVQTTVEHLREIATTGEIDPACSIIYKQR